MCIGFCFDSCKIMYKVFKNSIFRKSEKKYLSVDLMLMFAIVIYMYVYYIFMKFERVIFRNVYIYMYWYKYILVIKIIMFIVNK